MPQNVKEPGRDKFAVRYRHLKTPIIDGQAFSGRRSGRGFEPCNPFKAGSLTAGALLSDEMPPNFNMGGKQLYTSLNSMTRPVIWAARTRLALSGSEWLIISTRLAFCITSGKGDAPEFKFLDAVFNIKAVKKILQPRDGKSWKKRSLSS